MSHSFAIVLVYIYEIEKVLFLSQVVEYPCFSMYRFLAARDKTFHNTQEKLLYDWGNSVSRVRSIAIWDVNTQNKRRLWSNIHYTLE
jgi:hypothetical protein